MRKFNWVLVPEVGHYILENEQLNAVVRPAGRVMWEVFVDGFLPQYRPSLAEAKELAEDFVREWNNVG